ncbi:sodium-dependent glucose transporter 1A [Nematostella vectensis]|uniref:sodium-dependent glucose transporter 1A n=1 Tax=Nematostella vectensis TaxID=45351 RepID=UPI002076D736|nr:sodium-dependent glucose transporter 1A [Nematostella vectensis]
MSPWISYYISRQPFTSKHNPLLQIFHFGRSSLNQQQTSCLSSVILYLKRMELSEDENTATERNIAEILRDWDDEEDDLVEFIQTAPSEKGQRRNAGNGSSFRDVLIHEDGHTSVHRPREKSTLMGSAAYVKYSRRLKTAALFLAFFAVGMGLALYGPTLLDLKLYTSSTLTHMSAVFATRALGYLLGGLSGNWLFDRYDLHLVMGASALSGALGVVIFPIVDSATALAIMGFVVAVALGALYEGGKELVYLLWPNKTTQYTQYLHFIFALGAFFAPVLAKPLLLPDPSHTSISINVTAIPNTSGNGILAVLGGETLVPSYSPAWFISGDVNVDVDGIVPITWVYWVNAVLLGISGSVFLIFAFMKTCKEPYVKRPERLLVASVQHGRIYEVVILTLFLILLLVYVGLCTVFSGFVFTFAVYTHMTRAAAAMVTAGYWGSFAAMRLLYIPVLTYVKPPRMLLCDFIGCALAGTILVSQSSEGCDHSSSPKIWAGTIILGLSTASIFPATMAWVEFFLDISQGRAATILLLGACAGEMLLPLTVGSAIRSVGPCTLMYSVIVVSFLGILNFLAILMFARHYRSLGFPGVEFHRNREEPPCPPPTGQGDEVLKLLEQNNEIFSNGDYHDELRDAT